MKTLSSGKLENANFILKSKVNQTADFCACSSENGNILLYSLKENIHQCREYKFPSGIFDFDLLPSVGKSCILASQKDSPIQLRCLDNDNEKVSNSYKIKSHTDAFVPAISLAFSLDGTSFCSGTGRNGKLFVFQTESTNSDNCHEVELNGWKGSINCIKYFPSNQNILAFGSYNQNCIGICDLRNDLLAQTLFSYSGSGVFQVYPIGEHLLVSNSRKNDKIHLWDLRMNEIIISYFRECPDSFQKMYFDVIWTNEWFHLVYGDKNGNVYFRSINDPEKIKSLQIANSPVSSCSVYYGENEFRAFCSVGERFGNESSIHKISLV